MRLIDKQPWNKIQRVWPWRTARHSFVLAVSGGLLLLVIATLYAIQLMLRVDAAVDRARESALNLSEVLAEHSARTFEALERTLHEAEFVWRDLQEGRTTPEAARTALRLLKQTSRSIVAIGWTDAAGDLEVSSYEMPPPRSNIADQSYFQAQRDAPPRNLVIAPPFRSAATGQWISAVSRRLTNADGSFAGVIAAPLDHTYFTETFRLLRLGENGSVNLVHPDGIVMARVPFREETIGMSVRHTRLFTERAPASPSGTFESVSPLDGIRRIYGYKVVPHRGMIVVVTYDRAEVIAPIFRQVRHFAPIGLSLMAAIVIGIVLLVRQARALAANTAVLEATLEHMDQGLIMVDAQGTLPVCNRRALELLELPAELMAQRPRAEQVLAYQSARGEFETLSGDVEQQLNPKVRDGVFHTYERERPNGTVLEIRTKPIPEGGVVRTYTDVTARRRAEERFRRLLEAAPDAMVIVDAAGEIVLVNAQTERMFDYTRDELIGASVEILLPETVRAQHPAHRDRYFQDPHVRAMGLGRDLHGRRKDGSEFPIDINLSPLQTEHGTIVLSAIRDISEQKAAENALRTAKERAEIASRTEAEFLANMSHELRTPLTAIIGVADLLLGESRPAAEQRRFLEMQRSAGTTLLAIINDVLDFSKIEAGQLVFESLPVPLHETLEDCCAMFEGEARRKGLDLDLQIGNSAPGYIKSDPTRLRQVLLNLLSNAVKFTDKGSVRLIADMTSDQPPQLRLTITDTGIGIAPEQLPLLFERFTQADRSTTRKFGGSGLGLAISKRIVDRMGGHVGVESTLEAGSSFTVVIPVVPVASAPAGDKIGPRPRAERSCRVLLAEDNEMNRQLIATMLEQAGHHVEGVTNGAEAVSGALRGTFDIILMDVRMPVMDGYAACRAIRAALDPGEQIPIVGLTSNATAADAAACMEAGMDLHVAKPVEWSKLLAHIDRLVEIYEEDRASEPYELEPPAEAPVPEFDHVKFEQLLRQLGSDRVEQLLQLFQREAEGRFAESLDPEIDRAAIIEDAHSFGGSAGMLGFTELMARCRDLQVLVKAGAPLGGALNAARAARDAALAKLLQLRANSKVA